MVGKRDVPCINIKCGVCQYILMVLDDGEWYNVMLYFSFVDCATDLPRSPANLGVATCHRNSVLFARERCVHERAISVHDAEFFRVVACVSKHLRHLPYPLTSILTHRQS